jgi:tetratricopeptide (TPR) repeat protein
MDHIPESELAICAFEPDALSADRCAEIDRHTAACSACRATFDFFAMAEDDLGDADVWEPIVASRTLEALRAYAERIAAEDRDADQLLAPFFRAPATVAWTDIRTRKRFLTGGVVRRLNAHAHTVCDGEPLDALTFAEAAIAVAEALPEHTYPAGAVYELRGTAWKEQARALHLLGRFSEALESLTRAERAYSHTPSGFGLSAVALVRAAVLFEQRRLDEAASLAERAEQGFTHLGDDDRRMKALYLRAGIQYESGAIDAAVALYRRILEYGEAVNDLTWIARGSCALGNCELDRGDPGAASMHFHKALALFREVGPATDRVNTEWGIARVLLHVGKRSEAIRRLREVGAEYEKRGMVTDAALAGLDIADALLATGDMKEIVVLASRVFHVFMDAGMFTGALTAIAYIKEAAATETLTAAALDSVRTFLRRAERQPDLVFAPPPHSR